MFNFESNGYKREEVDVYVANLKNQLLQYKLDLLELEQKTLDVKKRSEALDIKEKNFMKAINAFEDSQKAQQESSKNLYFLKLEQLELINTKALEVINNICNRHPEVKHDETVNRIIEDFDSMVNSSKRREDISFITSKINTENDSIRMLLGKMQEYRKMQETPKEVRIERKQVSINPVDKKETDSINNESGFDLQEAVNPKQDLKEIMKAFDFFNNDGEF